MPKIEKISETKYRYKCICGAEITLETDSKEPIKKLIKCFKCLELINKEDL